MSTVNEQIDALVGGNTVYQQYVEQWRYLLVSYMGGDDYREGGFLQRYQMETSNEYGARLQSTPLDNHCGSVVRTYNSFLFRTPPQRTFNELAGSSEVEDFLKDADMDGS